MISYVITCWVVNNYQDMVISSGYGLQLFWQTKKAAQRDTKLHDDIAGYDTQELEDLVGS